VRIEFGRLEAGQERRRDTDDDDDQRRFEPPPMCDGRDKDRPNDDED
jgi:hypothetical protein